MKRKQNEVRLFDAASAPMLLVMIGIPLGVVLLVAALVLVAVVLITRAARKNRTEGQPPQNDQKERKR